FFPDGWDTGIKPEASADPPMRYLAELDARTGRPVPNSYFTKNAVITANQYSAPSLDPKNSSACTVEALAVSPDGKRLYIGGRVNNVNGHSVRRLAALKLDEGQPDDGTLDTSFTIDGGPSASVHSLDAVGDRVYVGGSFTRWGVGELPAVPGDRRPRPEREPHHGLQPAALRQRLLRRAAGRDLGDARGDLLDQGHPRRPDADPGRRLRQLQQLPALRPFR